MRPHQVLLSQLSAVPSEFLASITSASSSTKSPSIPPDDIVGPALDARDRLLEEMNADMEGLARHWEQVGDAARLGEEGLQEGELEGGRAFNERSPLNGGLLTLPLLPDQCFSRTQIICRWFWTSCTPVSRRCTRSSQPLNPSVVSIQRSSIDQSLSIATPFPSPTLTSPLFPQTSPPIPSYQPMRPSALRRSATSARSRTSSRASPSSATRTSRTRKAFRRF